MTSRNPITGDRLVSRVSSKEYEDNYDRIFRKKKEKKMTKNSMWIIRDLFNEAWGKDTHCEECVYLLKTVDSVPYGEGNVPMTSYTCECNDAYNCPYVIDKMEELENEQHD